MKIKIPNYIYLLTFILTILAINKSKVESEITLKNVFRYRALEKGCLFSLPVSTESKNIGEN